MFKKNFVFYTIIVAIFLFKLDLVIAEEESDSTTNPKVLDMISEIYQKKEQYEDLVGEAQEECTSYGSINIDCPGITVQGYGTYPLEEYVAGVLGPEFGSVTDNEEATKTFGMAIRTFAIRNTSNCKTTIGATDAAQVFNSSFIESYREKAGLSSGLVITNSEGLYPVSYALSRPSDCEEGASSETCTIKRCYVWNQNQNLSGCTAGYSTSVIPTNILNWNGYTHFGGLEAYITQYYANENGYDAQQLIKHFYGDTASISSLNGSSSSSSGSNSCSLGGEGYAEVDGITFPLKNYNLEGTSNGLGPEFDVNVGNVSQCPWYAKYRAIEIVMSSTLDDDLKEKAKAVLLATNGNGNEWYGGTNSTLKYFKYSSDITQPKPGSIVAWSKGDYGHVGIIEDVYPDGSVLLSDGWNRLCAECANSVNSIKIFTRKMTQEQLKTYNGSYSFIGYTYLFSYKK